MKFFLDTADLGEIQEAASWGVLDGVTTNPSLVSKTGAKFRDLIYEICNVVDGPVSAEVVGLTKDKMIAEARELVRIHKHVVVKIPVIIEGIKAIKELAREGIKVNVTLCFSPTQALLAAKVGAAYISPFIGRLDDVSQEGMSVIRDIKQIYSHYGFKTQILVASVRNPLHVLEAAKAGADIVTLPFKVLQQLIQHPLTDIGLERFLADWERYAGENLVNAHERL